MKRFLGYGIVALCMFIHATGPGLHAESLDRERCGDSKASNPELDQLERMQKWETKKRPRLNKKMMAALKDTHDANSLIALGMLGDWQQAAEHFEKASHIAPDSALPHVLLAMTLQGSWDGRTSAPEEKRDYARAMKEIEQARALEPGNALYDILELCNHFLQGHMDKAIQSLELLTTAKLYQFDQAELVFIQIKAAQAAKVYDDVTGQMIYLGSSIINLLPLQATIKAGFPETQIKDGIPQPLENVDRSLLPAFELRRAATLNVMSLLYQEKAATIERGMSIAFGGIVYGRMKPVYDAVGETQKSAELDELKAEMTRRRVLFKAEIDQGLPSEWSGFKSERGLN